MSGKTDTDWLTTTVWEEHRSYLHSGLINTFTQNSCNLRNQSDNFHTTMQAKDQHNDALFSEILKNATLLIPEPVNRLSV